jgi:hypothetical protein
MPMLTRQAYETHQANKPAGYVPPDKRSAAPGTFEEAFPTLGEAPKKPIAKWGAPKPAVAAPEVAAPEVAAPEVAATVATAEPTPAIKPTSIWGSSKIKDMISGTLAAPVVSTVEHVLPKYAGARVRVIDVSTVESASRDLAKYGDVSGNTAFLDNIRDRIAAETREQVLLDEYYKLTLPDFTRYHQLQRQRIAEQKKKRWIFDQSSSEEEVVVPEDDYSEMYPSDDEGVDSEGNEIVEGNEYEFRR